MTNPARLTFCSWPEGTSPSKSRTKIRTIFMKVPHSELNADRFVLVRIPIPSQSLLGFFSSCGGKPSECRAASNKRGWMISAVRSEFRTGVEEPYPGPCNYGAGTLGQLGLRGSGSEPCISFESIRNLYAGPASLCITPSCLETLSFHRLMQVSCLGRPVRS
jgi:hypothetical protein